MNTNEKELLIGLISLVVSIVWGIKEFRDWKKLDNWWLKSYGIEIIGGLVILFLIGIAGVYRYFS